MGRETMRMPAGRACSAISLAVVRRSSLSDVKVRGISRSLPSFSKIPSAPRVHPACSSRAAAWPGS